MASCITEEATLTDEIMNCWDKEHIKVIQAGQQDDQIVVTELSVSGKGENARTVK
jgi:hypothetical protein